MSSHIEPTIRQRNLDHLESQLEQYVRSFLQSLGEDDTTAQDEALRWVCTGLEYLLGSLLDDCEGWSGWVDGVVAAHDMLGDDAVVTSPTQVIIRGQAIWGKTAGGGQWIEPLFAALNVGPDSGVGYEIKFANAAETLGKVGYGKHVRWPHWYSPDEWRFVIKKNLGDL